MIMDSPPARPAVSVLLAQRVRALREAHGLSLEALAHKTGVSKSMISLIERAQASATAVILERLATGLHVPLASLFAPHEAAQSSAVSRAPEQPLWSDPASGYVRRSLSPATTDSPLSLVEVLFPAGARVTYETAQRTPRMHQQIWVIEGAMQVSVGEACYALTTGDCLAMELNAPILFHNPGARPARYLVAITTEPMP